MTEKRSYPRFKLSEGCNGRFGNFQRFCVEEVGMGGLRLLSSFPAACGSTSHIYVESADNLQDFTVEVLRVSVQGFVEKELRGFQPGPLYQVSVRFVDLSDAQRLFLIRLLESCYASEPDTRMAMPEVTGSLPAAPLPGPERRAVLIADDDAAIREVLVEILQVEGFPVLQASDGDEACDLFELNREAIGLVTLDIDMPRLNGYEAYRRIRALDPGVRVLFISGAIRFPRQQISDADWLDKPFGTETFIRYVTGAVGVNGHGQFARLAEAAPHP